MQNRRIVDKAFAAVNTHPTPRLETNSIMNLLSSVKSMGLSSIMPEYFIGVLGALEGVRAVPLVNPKSSIQSASLPRPRASVAIDQGTIRGGVSPMRQLIATEHHR